jgi:hypothetical protein
MFLDVLNIEGKNFRHGPMNNWGSFGHIYRGTFLNQKLVIKCIPISDNYTRFRAIR